MTEDDKELDAHLYAVEFLLADLRARILAQGSQDQLAANQRSALQAFEKVILPGFNEPENREMLARAANHLETVFALEREILSSRSMK